MPKIQNIFVVDNNPNDVKTTMAILKNVHAKLMDFTDPNEALEKMADISPDIILLDYYMPKMTGAEFMVKVSERLLQNPNWQVYLVTSKEFDEEEQASMLTLGITKIFHKPLNKDELYQAIEQFEAS